MPAEPATHRRELAFEGCSNVRDLGGLALQGGGHTRFGEVVRGDHPRKLTTRGWDALLAYGVRTIVTLQSDGARGDTFDTSSWPSELELRTVAIEDFGETDFLPRWGETGLLETPFYYSDALRRWPARHTAASQAVARAAEGAVLFHCVRGHDRTGLIALLLLALAGVTAADIAADYQRSGPNMPAADQQKLRVILAREERTVADGLAEVLDTLDAATYLRDGGLTPGDVEAIRRRLTSDPPSGEEAG